jgi:hypothetical protein
MSYYESDHCLAVPTICGPPGIEIQPRPNRIVKTEDTSDYWERGRTRRQREMRTIVPMLSTPAQTHEDEGRCDQVKCRSSLDVIEHGWMSYYCLYLNKEGVPA